MLCLAVLRFAKFEPSAKFLFCQPEISLAEKLWEGDFASVTLPLFPSAAKWTYVPFRRQGQAFL
jgi:hypothetical protein